MNRSPKPPLVLIAMVGLKVTLWITIVPRRIGATSLAKDKGMETIDEVVCGGTRGRGFLGRATGGTSLTAWARVGACGCGGRRDVGEGRAVG